MRLASIGRTWAWPLLPLFMIACGAPADAGDVDASLDAHRSSHPVIDAGEDGANGDPGDAGSSGNDSDSGEDGAAPDTDAGHDSGPATISCDAPGTCASATTYAKTFSGDTLADSAVVHGTTSQWFSVRVTEDDSSVSGRPLTFQARLTPPAGADFDLFVYVNTADDVRECSSISDVSVLGAGQTDVVNLSWGEGSVANFVDDDRSVSVEVRHVSGDCSAGAPWTLSFRGNP